MRVAIISDTHLPRGPRRIPGRCVEIIESSDLLLHAGDFVGRPVLDEIESIGVPVAAVHGNVDSEDLRSTLPGELELDLAGAQLAVLHDAGPARGRLDRLRSRFGAADAVVFGHSHIPLHETCGGFQIFNPGSPTDPRRQPHPTMGLATIEDGTVRFELIWLT